MKIYSHQLAQTFKQKLFPVYLITGDEFLLVEEAAEQIYEQGKTQQITERQRWQTDKNFNWQTILDAANSFSLFDDNCVLDVSLTSNTLTDTAKDILITYCKNPPDNKILLLKTSKIDGRTLTSGWCKAIEEKGCIIQCWPIAFQQFPAWIRQRLQTEGLSASSEAIQFIAEQTEGNLLAAKQEIEKLKLLYDKKNLQLDDVIAAMSDNARYDIFQLADCALAGDTKRTLRIIRSLHAENTEPTLILWALVREIRTLLDIKTRQKKGDRLEVILQQSGVWEKRKPIVTAALKRLKTETLFRLIEQSSHLDRIIKGVADGNSWDHLTALSLKFSGCASVIL